MNHPRHRLSRRAERVDSPVTGHVVSMVGPRNITGETISDFVAGCGVVNDAEGGVFLVAEAADQHLHRRRDVLAHSG